MPSSAGSGAASSGSGPQGPPPGPPVGGCAGDVPAQAKFWGKAGGKGAPQGAGYVSHKQATGTTTGPGPYAGTPYACLSENRQRQLKNDPAFWTYVRRNCRSRGWYDMYDCERRDILCNLVAALAHGKPVPDYSHDGGNTNLCAELTAFKGWIPVQVLAGRWLVSQEPLLSLAGGEGFVRSPTGAWLKAVDSPQGERISWPARAMQGLKTTDQPTHRALARFLLNNAHDHGVWANPPEGVEIYTG